MKDINKRPCIASDKKALFHMWVEQSEIIPPSIMKGGHSGGVIKDIFALVEFEDGTVAKVYPHKIKFLDNIFKEYYFGE